MKMRKQVWRDNIQYEAGLVVMIAWAVDMLGEPPAALHPVIWYGNLIRRLERLAPERSSAQLVYGAAMPVFAAGVVLPPVWLLQMVVRQSDSGHWTGKLLSATLEGIILKPFFALRMLADAGARVRLFLEQNDIVMAREALLSLVSRDRSSLSAELVAAATIESLAENLSDSMVAPLFYYAFLGLPGAALYRLVNTFDSMIGYHGRYEYLGKAVARLDDIVNFVPSRITALLIILCASCYGGDVRSGWRIWQQDCQQTESPNAGHPMAAAAGALDVRLEKVGHYVLGAQGRLPDAGDIKRAERMVWLVGGIAVVLTSLVRIFRKGKRRR